MSCVRCRCRLTRYPFQLSTRHHYRHSPPRPHSPPSHPHPRFPLPPSPASPPRPPCHHPIGSVTCESSGVGVTVSSSVLPGAGLSLANEPALEPGPGRARSEGSGLCRSLLLRVSRSTCVREPSNSSLMSFWSVPLSSTI